MLRGMGGGKSRCSRTWSESPSGSGQASPAILTRCRYSLTVLLPMPQLWPMSRLLRRHSCFNRNISPILRIDNLCPGMTPPFVEWQSKRVPLPGGSLRRHPPRCLAGFLWNQWPGSRGIRGRNQMESPAGITWNPWPGSSGICNLIRARAGFQISKASAYPFLVRPPQSVGNTADKFTLDPLGEVDRTGGA